MKTQSIESKTCATCGKPEDDFVHVLCLPARMEGKCSRPDHATDHAFTPSATPEAERCEWTTMSESRCELIAGHSGPHRFDGTGAATLRTPEPPSEQSETHVESCHDTECGGCGPAEQSEERTYCSRCGVRHIPGVDNTMCPITVAVMEKRGFVPASRSTEAPRSSESDEERVARVFNQQNEWFHGRAASFATNQPDTAALLRTIDRLRSTEALSPSTMDEIAERVWRVVLSQWAAEGLATHDGCEADAPAECSLYDELRNALTERSRR